MKPLPLRTLLLLTLITLTTSIIDRTYYKYLGLDITATPQQIQQAFNTKQQKILNTESQQQQKRKLPLLQIAYDTLYNQKSRELYERYGKDYKKYNIKQITSLNPFSGHDSRKGPTMHLHVPVSVEELYNGTTVKGLFQTRSACTKCQGTGADSLKSLKDCNICGGKGFSMIQGRNMYGQAQMYEGICPHCQGTGKLVTKQCPVCKGQKLVDTLKPVQIQIPAKYTQSQMRIKNTGPQQPMGAPSDFLIHIEQIASQKWRRQGNHLIYTMKISLQESIFGFSKVIYHLSGEQIKIERIQPTTKSTKIQLPNKGFTAQGKLVIQFLIAIQQFTDRQLDLWEQFFHEHKL